MKIAHLFTGSDNPSHLEEIDVPFKPREDLGLFTLPEKARAVFSGIFFSGIQVVPGGDPADKSKDLPQEIRDSGLFRILHD
jgi:hypothetical protein